VVRVGVSVALANKAIGWGTGWSFQANEWSWASGVVELE
jgi:hypothetical protein